MKKLTLLALFASIVAVGAQAADAPSAPAPAPNTLGPRELVENSAKRMLAELDANRPMYQKDPAKLDGLVGEHSAAEFRHRVCGAARAEPVVAHGDP